MESLGVCVVYPVEGAYGWKVPLQRPQQCDPLCYGVGGKYHNDHYFSAGGGAHNEGAECAAALFLVVELVAVQARPLRAKVPYLIRGRCLQPAVFYIYYAVETAAYMKAERSPFVCLVASYLLGGKPARGGKGKLQLVAVVTLQWARKRGGNCLFGEPVLAQYWQ